MTTVLSFLKSLMMRPFLFRAGGCRAQVRQKSTRN